MARRHSTGRLTTLAAVALLCWIGTAGRLPTPAETVAPAFRVSLAGANLSGSFATAVGTVQTDTPRPATITEARTFSAAFADVAARVTPAVVRIQTERNVEAHQGVRDRLQDMFDLPEGHPDAVPPPQLAGGTGFLVSSDGLVLTNNHVIAGADRILVTLWDKRVFPGRVVGSDPTTDIALIRLEAGGPLPAAPLGDSDAVRVGEWLLAIGNPGFYDQNTLDFTVTSGILSAKGRPLDIIRQELQATDRGAARYAIEDFLQTDAAINPGNSGGPLIDLEGRVIGINTAIASGTGFNQGYGFAIPINVARRVMEDLLEYGRVRRPLLGISIANIGPEDAEVYRLPRIAGVLVEDFQNDSPARKAGLQRHDVIVGVDGDQVERLGQFQRLVARRDPGDIIEVDVIRYGAPLRFQVRLTEADLGGAQVVRTSPGEQVDRNLGIEVADLTPSLARDRRFRRTGGAYIVAVAPGSVAGRRGVLPDTRIRSINRQDVASAQEAERILSAAPSGSVLSLLLEDVTGSTYIRNLRVP